MAEFVQQTGETTAAWLARLQAVALSELSGADRRSLLGSEQTARGQAGRERRDAAADLVRQTDLGQARAAFLRLPPEERQQFLLWLAQGAPDEDGQLSPSGSSSAG